MRQHNKTTCITIKKLEKPAQIQEDLPHLEGNIMNLSNYKLNNTEKKLLAHGLKFVPAPPKIKQDIIIEGAENFSLRARRQYFFNKKNKTRNPLPFLPSSEWEPPDSAIPADLLKVLGDTIKEAKEMDLPKPTPNLSTAEYQSLNKLSKNKSIVIKKADKGSAVVLLNRDDYIKEGERQLSDTNYYRELLEPIYLETAAIFDQILKELEEIPGEVGGRNQDGICGINEKQYEFLRPPCEDFLRERIFYLLPKIHKDPAKWPFPFKIPPGRPIVSDCSSEGYNIAAFIDYFLQPIAASHDSYIKDTNHFLEIVKQTEASADCLIVTADVDAMYTNIDHDQGIEAVRKALQKNPPTMDNPRIPDEYLLRLLEISLKRNDFHFNLKTYLQVKGTAMGKKFAPSYANIFMAEWEEDIMQRVPTKPEIWKRYLDDCFTIWNGSKESLQEFFEFLNNDNPSIHLKMEISDTSVSFLDTVVFKGDRINTEHRLSTKVYRKPTDTMELLHKESFHPPHTFSGIIKSQVLRFHRLCTEESDFDAACMELFQALLPRGYTWNFLTKIKEETLQELSNPWPKEIQRSRFSHYLEDSLDSYQSKPCGKRTCRTCPLIVQSSTFSSTKTSQVFQLQHSLDCGSSEVVYLITCARCGLQYVGETALPLRQRLWKYRNRIESTEPHTNLTLVEEHFRPENDHEGMQDFSIIPIAQRINPTEDPTYGSFLRQTIEEFWIKVLRTKDPDGLNTKFKGESSVLPLITPYSVQTKEWSSEIINKWNRDVRPIHRHILPNRTLAAFSRSKNLTDILCTSRLPQFLFDIAEKEIQEELVKKQTEENIQTLVDLANDN